MRKKCNGCGYRYGDGDFALHPDYCESCVYEQERSVAVVAFLVLSALGVVISSAMFL